MIIKFLLNRCEYNNFLKGKYRIDWYIIRSKMIHLSPTRVKSKTFILNLEQPHSVERLKKALWL